MLAAAASWTLCGAAHATGAAPAFGDRVSSFSNGRTTLRCEIRGSVGAMVFKSNGKGPSFRCNAHCEWVAGKQRFRGDLAIPEIGKYGTLERWTREFGAELDRSENARLDCLR